MQGLLDFKKISRTTAILLFLLCCASLGFAQTLINSATAANRSAALRYLERTKSLITSMNWQEAFDHAQTGLQYDSSISDLWYVQALASRGLKQPLAETLVLVEKALEGEPWVQYNRDAGRLLYAELLCDTCSWEKSLSVLDEKPMVFSSDAEFLRAKNYYRLGQTDKARACIKAARSLFPADGRFAQLFFINERNNAASDDVLNLAGLLLKNLTAWTKNYPDLVLYAADFSASAQERSRLLKAWSARGLRHQLYPVLALKYALISEKEGFELFKSFSLTGIDFQLFQEFVSLLHTDQMRAELETWLTAFAGKIVFDTNNDGIIDLVADYERGRPSYVVYDENQDGVANWSVHCDFGVPYLCALPKLGIEVEYEQYPCVSRTVLYNQTEYEIYELTADTLFWSPLYIEEAALSPLMCSFFIPRPKQKLDQISKRMLLAAANMLEMPSQERPDAIVRFTLLDGQAQSALYLSAGQPYAFGVFNRGVLSYRNVDMDNDGFFELTEKYVFNPELSPMYQTEQEEALLHKRLFATAETVTGLYLWQIVSDLDKDGQPDFIEEYLPYGGKVSSWDTKGSGTWTIRSIKKAISESFDSGYSEEDCFIYPLTNEEVRVVFERGVPVAVQTNRGKQPIFKDVDYNVFWIGRPQTTSEAARIITAFGKNPSPGTSVIVSISGKRMLAVYTGTSYYGEVFDE